MCGRYTYKLTWEEIVRLYRLTLDVPAQNIQPRYNICPTTPVDVVVSSDRKRSIVPMRWGLVPIWWKKALKEMPATFNARAETVATSRCWHLLDRISTRQRSDALRFCLTRLVHAVSAQLPADR
jgi:putative SOS response-associated peptidase YedK